MLVQNIDHSRLTHRGKVWRLRLKTANCEGFYGNVGGGGDVPSGVGTNPPNQVILPPSSFFLKSSPFQMDPHLNCN